MAKITIEELSDSLKEYLSELGLTEEQVNSLIQNKLGDLSNLETVNKDNIVNSVNEVKDTVAFVGTAIFGSENALYMLTLLVDKRYSPLSIHRISLMIRSYHISHTFVSLELYNRIT